MSLGLLSRPIVTSCNWNAAGNPIVYRFRRLDNSVSAINDNGGDMQVQLNGSDLTAYYEVGDEVSLYDNNIQASITASTFSAGNTLITLDYPYSAIVEGVIINLSKRTDYRIYINITDLASANILPTELTFSPNKRGEIVVDVSIAKNYLTPDWIEPSVINEVEAGTSLPFYLKYAEFYDNTLGSYTVDSSFPVQAVFASMQIGSANGGNMLDYFISNVTKKFLQKFQPGMFRKMVMWRDWPFTLSFIYPDGLGTLIRKTIQFDAAGGQISSLETNLAANDNAINRTFIGSLSSLCKRLTLRLQQVASATFLIPDNSFSANPLTTWTNIDNGGAPNWGVSVPGDSVRVNLINGEVSDFLRSSAITPYSMSADDIITAISFTVNMAAGKGVTFRLYGWDGVAREVLGQQAAIGTGADQVVNFLTINTPANDNSEVELWAECTNATGGSQVQVSEVNMTAVANEYVVSETLDIEVRDVCGYNSDYEDVLIEKNPIHLFCKNSVGGDVWWNFEAYHEYQYTYSNGKKAKRIQLFASQLHPVQWEALQDFNTTGEVYRNYIPELTSSVVKTSTRVGQQVYIVSQDGSKKTGVIVIPDSESSFAKDNVNIFSVTIELPEVFQI